MENFIFCAVALTEWKKKALKPSIAFQTSFFPYTGPPEGLLQQSQSENFWNIPWKTHVLVSPFRKNEIYQNIPFTEHLWTVASYHILLPSYIFSKKRKTIFLRTA